MLTCYLTVPSNYLIEGFSFTTTTNCTAEIQTFDFRSFMHLPTYSYIFHYLLIPILLSSPLATSTSLNFIICSSGKKYPWVLQIKAKPLKQYSELKGCFQPEFSLLQPFTECTESKERTKSLLVKMACGGTSLKLGEEITLHAISGLRLS